MNRDKMADIVTDEMVVIDYCGPSPDIRCRLGMTIFCFEFVVDEYHPVIRVTHVLSAGPIGFNGTDTEPISIRWYIGAG
jgi:hypothetical protein